MTQKQFVKRFRELEESGLCIAIDIDSRVLSKPRRERKWITWWGLTSTEAVKLLWSDPLFMKDFLGEVRQAAQEIVAAKT